RGALRAAGALSFHRLGGGFGPPSRSAGRSRPGAICCSAWAPWLDDPVLEAHGIAFLGAMPYVEVDVVTKVAPLAHGLHMRLDRAERLALAGPSRGVKVCDREHDCSLGPL